MNEMDKLLTCYKYRSGKSALDSLLKGEVYFASPSQLNDSLESKFDFASTAKFAEIFNQTMHELALQRGIVVSNEWIKSTPHGLQAVNANENDRLKSWCQNAGIFSAARRPDNQAMWAYYCNNSRGVCFHLEWPDEVVEKYRLLPAEVTYTKDARIHNRAEDFRELMLELGRQNPSWTMNQLMAFSITENFRRLWGGRTQARALSKKHVNWEHEQEVRLLSPKAEALPILKDILRSVIFQNSDFEEWQEIVKTVYEKYPAVQLFDMQFEHKEPFVRSRKYRFRTVTIEAPES